MSSDDSTRGRPVALTYETLEKLALGYLDRFDSTVVNLQRVLLRKVRATAGDEDARTMVDRLLAQYVRDGILDDRRYAATMAAGLRRRGASLRAIRRKLAARGVDEATVGSALDAEGIDEAGELEAAQRLVKKRKLGPWRKPGERVPRRARDFAVLARAGFSLEVSRLAMGDRGDDEPYA